MTRRLISAVTLTLFVVLSPIAHSQDSTAAPNPAVAAADHLYDSGKFAHAEESYRDILKTDPKLVPAEFGLVRSLLEQYKVDDALDTVNAALTATPNSAPLLAAKGDVLFRLGDMAEADRTYVAANRIDPKEVHVHLGLARLYRSYSLYRKAYDRLQFAHEIAPNDIEVQRAWMQTLPRKQKLAALEAYLAGPHPDDEEDTQHWQEYLEFLKSTADAPVHACRLVSKVESTATRLEPMMHDAQHLRGIGLTVVLNGHNNRLLFDTGAGGIIISRRAAEKAGLERISTQHYGGIGDKGWQTGYTAIANDIKIGELEFQDCVVHVSDARSLAEEDGLIGADVMASYLVDIDLPGMQLKLSPLPKRPEDTVAPKSLNSEGEDQATAEQKENSAAAPSATANPSQPSPVRLPKDRYVAPEMADWTKVFRFGHTILVPTSVNGSNDMLFGLDTGAFENLISVRAARQVTKYSADPRIQVRGLSGSVQKVYSADNVTLTFARMRQTTQNMISIDMEKLSHNPTTSAPRSPASSAFLCCACSTSKSTTGTGWCTSPTTRNVCRRRCAEWNVMCPEWRCRRLR